MYFSPEGPSPCVLDTCVGDQHWNPVLKITSRARETYVIPKVKYWREAVNDIADKKR